MKGYIIRHGLQSVTQRELSKVFSVIRCLCNNGLWATLQHG